ncbi:hypothetical protein [Aureispira anguillae]|uniref:Uncharacterized protein n=1 Tax=Aureispira anguillae TaxID=2864201 RepID=A0A915YCH7_9BACT|nr:hypothetical protein [Aureispira anguillae]BDS10559.1 hypothetical protein AsAng_0012670 [Aureispira anguillae]
MSTNVDKNSAHNSMDALSTLVYTAKKLLKYQELFLVVVTMVQNAEFANLPISR